MMDKIKRLVIVDGISCRKLEATEEEIEKAYEILKQFLYSLGIELVMEIKSPDKNHAY